MKPRWLLGGLLFSCSYIAQAKPVDTELRPVRTQDGLVLTPMRVPLDETRDMLNTKLWRYSVKAPQVDMDYTGSLELRQEGKKTVALQTFTVNSYRDGMVSLEMMPLPAADSEMTKAEQIKLYYRYEGDGDRVTSRYISMKNPVKDIVIPNISFTTNTTTQFSPEGETTLMEFNVGEAQNPQKASLVWTFHGVPHGVRK